MGAVLWHITMSLDGFIAGPDDDMTWLGGYVGPNPTVDDVLPNIGAVLMGNHTFHLAENPNGKVYGGAWTGPQFVLTRDAPETAPAGLTYLSGDTESAVATARAAAGDKYVVILGANTAQRCLDAGLLDEILVHLAPVMLGDGVRLFDRPGGANVKLEPIRLDSTPQIANLWYRVMR